MNHKKIEIDIGDEYFENGIAPFKNYLKFLSKKNNATLHLIEEYIGIPLDSDEKLKEIKNNILDVSGSVSRIPYQILFVGEDNERF